MLTEERKKYQIEYQNKYRKGRQAFAFYIDHDIEFELLNKLNTVKAHYIKNNKKASIKSIIVDAIELLYNQIEENQND